VSLEKLVATPEKVVREICQFVEIDYDEAMLRIDLSHSHSGRWKTELDENERVQIQNILVDTLTKLGYE
jgi:hypothetical protein